MESNRIGARVAERRNEMGLKQRELADMLSVKRETVNQWENGIRQIKGEDIARLADALETTTDYILRGIKPENLDIFRETGLSDKAIVRLKNLKSGNGHGPLGVAGKGYSFESVSTISKFIESEYFLELFNNIELYLIYGEVLPEEAYKTNEPELTLPEYERFYKWANDRGLEIIAREDVKDMYLQKACDTIKGICKEMLEDGKHSREKK